MAYLKNRETGVAITRYLNFNRTQDVSLTVKTAIDGTEYLTRFGRPVYNYELEVYVNNEGKDALMYAADTLDELEVSVRIGTFHGRIKSLGAFDCIYYGWYKTTVLLTSTDEVNER